MVEATESPVSSGKAMKEAAERAYDAIAEREGIDEHGDPVEDDDPEIEASAEDEPEVEEPEIEGDEPEVEASGEEDPELEAGDGAVEEDHGPLIAPHTWPQELKDQFKELPDGAKQILIKQNDNMNAAFTKAMTGVAEMKRGAEGMHRAVSAHTDRLARAGINPETAIQRSLAWDAHLQKDPEQGIRDMAVAYGVDLGKVAAPQEQPTQYMTPTERKLYQDNQQVKAQLEQFGQQTQQWTRYQQAQAYKARQDNAGRMLDEFMNATDDDGNQLHPFIEHCAPMMQEAIESGKVGNLQEAYDYAVFKTPEVRTALEKRRQAAKLKGKKRQVAKAKRASGSGIVRKGKTPPSKAPRSTENQVKDAWDKIHNA